MIELPVFFRGGNDKVYILEKRWIRNPETLAKLGGDFNNIEEVSNLGEIKEGQPIDLKDEPVEEKPKVVPPPSMSEILKTKKIKVTGGKDGRVFKEINKK